jgi:DNA-binding transcriptional MerR regulator
MLAEKTMEWLDAREVEKRTHLTQNVIRKLVQHYKIWLNIKKGANNSNLYSSNAVDTMVKIKKMSASGLKREEIRAILAQDEVSLQSDSNLEVMRKIHRLEARVAQLHQENVELRHQVTSSIEELSRKLKRRGLL